MISYLTLEQMRNQVTRHIQDSSDRRKTQIDEWLNTAYYDFAMRHLWPGLKRGSEATLTFTANSKFLYLPKDCWQLYFIMPGDIKRLAAHQTIRNFFDKHSLSFDSNGTVETYADAGEQPIKADFSTTAEKITATVSASDTFDLVVHGILNSDRDEVIETISFAGDTSKETTNTYVDLVSVSTNGSQSNLVSITGSTSSTEYATISAGERTTFYKRLRLWAVPSTATTYSLFYKRRPTRLINDDQVPEIPVSHAMINYAIALQYSQQRKWDSGYAVHRQESERMLMEAFEHEVMQGYRVEQGAPVRGVRAQGFHGRIVVSNSS